MVIILFGTLSACATSSGSVAPDLAGSIWNTETFLTTDPVVSVTVAVLDPPPSATQVQVVRRVRDDGAVYLGTTPWRRTLTGRRPVGVVVESGRVTSQPAAPYWALLLTTDGEWRMVAQNTLDQPAPRDESHDIQVAVGGFYPLIREGRVVSEQFPGTRIRAERVAVGGTGGDDPRLVIVATGSGRGTGAVGGTAASGGDRGGSEADPGGPDARGGLTTGELAHVLHRYDVDWALNLDGGRSAYLRFPNGARRPRRVLLRRRGPVLLRVVPTDSDRSSREMIE